MKKAHIRKKKRISFLFILTFGMILGSININQLFFISNNSLVNEITDDKDGMDDSLLTSYASTYSDSGANIDVVFHQSYINNSYNTYLSNLTNSNLFTIPCPINPTFNSSYTEMTVTDIYAPNKTIIVEDYVGVAWQDADDIYASFEVQGVGYIENISFYMIHTGGINPWQLVDIYLFEAEDDLSNLRPKDTSGTLIYSGLNVSNVADWYTAINIHEPFNASVPENKTYFIYTDISGLGICNWRYSFDSDGQDYDDESIVLDAGESEIQYLASSIMDTIDLSLKVSVSPLNNTPRPQDINLTVNDNAVVNSTAFYDNKGIVSVQNKGYSDSDGNLDLEVKADWWDVSCNITKAQINYTKTDVKASSEFTVPGSGQEIFWNTTIDENVNWFDNRLKESYINFTIPSQWNNVSVLNGGVEQTITITPSNSKTVTALNAGNGTHWYLNATSDNLLDNIHYIVNNILRTDKTVNFTNTVHFNASFNTFINTNDGNINVSVYSPNSQTLNFTMQNITFSSGLNISLGDWNMPNSIPYGVHTVQLYWSNDTDAGFVEDQLTILGVTDLIVTFPAYIFNVSDNFNIVAHFNDTGKNLPISDNPISYQIEGNSPRTDNIALAGNGSYIITIDCNDTELTASGPNDITINADKQYYYNQTQTESITILRETDLTIIDPSGGASYDSGDIFNITVQFNDTFETEGIQNALINYSINGNAYRYDNINYWEEGKYNITIYCNDAQFDEYGSLNIVVNASRHYYHNQSETLNIQITGETTLAINTPSNDDPFDSDQTFQLKVTYTDSARSQGISGAYVKYSLNGGANRTGLMDHANGSYSITVYCNDTDFGEYGIVNIAVYAGKPNFYNNSDNIDVILTGKTTLVINTPLNDDPFDSDQSFLLKVTYTDSARSLGISGAYIKYNLDGVTNRTTGITDHLNGSYSFTVNCNDANFTEYGSVAINVYAGKPNYYNNSASINVTITGVTELTINKVPDQLIYTSEESFNISISFMDTSRSSGISGTTLVFKINGTTYSPYIHDYGNGNYNVTIDCSDSWYSNYGWFNFTISASKSNYYMDVKSIDDAYITGQTVLTLISPPENKPYVIGEIFTIVLEYNDTVKGQGIVGATIEYSLDGSTWLVGENVTYDGNGRYSIEIYANDTGFGNNYKWIIILINASKLNHTESITSFTFDRQITTTITQLYQDLGPMMKGENVTYIFSYNETTSAPIIGANFSLMSSDHNFIRYWDDFGNGSYRILLNSINVDVAYSPFIYSFNISALGNQTQGITLNISLTTTWTDIVVYDYNATLISRLGYNQTVLLYFNDTTNNNPVTGVKTGNCTVWDNSTGVDLERDGGAGDHNWTLHEIGGGYYVLNISTKGMISGRWITLTIEMDKLPNWDVSTEYISFYLVGNSSLVDIQTMHDIDGKLIPEGSNKNYTWIENRQILINFTVEDTDHSPNLAIGNTTWRSATWFNYYDLNDNGTLVLSQIDYHDGTRSHQWTMHTDTLLQDSYIINITIKIPNYEAVTFSFNLTVRAIIQTSITIISFNDTLIQRDGLNQTIWLTFNSTEGGSPIGGASTTDVFVFDNSTGSFLVRDTWTLYEDSGTIGLYKLNVSINGMISGYVRLRINMSFYPDYEWSFEFITFYLTGNSTQISVISWTDEGGIIITPEGGNYTWFDDRNVNVTFSVQDINNGNNNVSGNFDIISVSWYKFSDASSGTLTISYGSYGTTRYSLLTISPLSLGAYSINFTVKINNYESSMKSYNLTIREKYALRLTNRTLNPAELTAGDLFMLSFIVEYNNDTDWLPLSGVDMRLFLYINGQSTAIDNTNWETTEVNGSIVFSLIIPTETTSMRLVLEIEEGYFYSHVSLEITDISVSPYVGGGGIDPAQLMMWLIIIGAAIGAVAGSIGIYRGVIVPKKREKARILSEVKTIFDDAVNLEHILVLYKNSGMCIFFKSFGLEEIDPEMISGFLSAVSSFGKEMESQEMLNEITYGDKVLLLSDGEFVRVALVLGKDPSVPIRQNLKEFIAAFENSYANILPTWRGNLKAYQGAGIIVDEILNTSIILPHEIKHSSKGVKSLKKPNSKDILKIAQNLVADSERKYFFIGQLLTLATDKLDRDLAEIFMGVKELRDKKLLVPIEISAIEEKPISEQELNLIRQKVAQLTHLAPDVTEKLVNDIASITSPAEREAFIVSLGAHQTIVSAPVKGGAAVIDSEKSAKKEIKALLNKAAKSEKQDDFTRALEIYHNANVLASNYELAKLIDEINDLVRKATIHESDHKMRDYEEKAKKAVKTVKYKEAAQFYRLASDMASQMFKLGRTDMTKEVKRLTNKSKECERLGE